MKKADFVQAIENLLGDDGTPLTPHGQAIAAGDGTLHGAIDHWQERALKAEADAFEMAAGQCCVKEGGLMDDGYGHQYCDMEQQRDELKERADRAEAENEKYLQALSLASTIAGEIPVDVNDPVSMVQEIIVSINKLRAERDAAREDAERYRFLRSVDPDAELPATTLHKQNSWGKWYYSPLLGEELDAAIDAARGKE